MYYVLLVLHKQRCGVEIVEEVSFLTNKRIQLGPGTLYTILSQFEGEGLIEETKIEGRRRSYVITGEGKTLIRDEQKRLSQMITDANNYLLK